MKKKIVIFLIFMILLATNVKAMSVQHIPDYQSYKPIGWNVYTGVEIDLSTAGFSFELPIGGDNTTLINLQSPDGTTQQWFVYVRLYDISSNSSWNPQHLSPPPIRVRVECGSSGGVFNLTTALPNSTWNTGYSLFLLTYDTEGMIPIAYPSETGNPLHSPTGRDLFVLQRFCYFEVFPSDWAGDDPNDFVQFFVWNVNPSREAICNIDPAVTYLQETTVGLIDINYQIWVILFDLFLVVAVLLTIFGLPVLLFRLVRWIIEELKKFGGGRKVF